MLTRWCDSCGDSTYKDVGPRRALTPHERLVWDTHCRECADELLFGIVSVKPIKTIPPGRGCPLEPNDDAGPWQEKVIRELEDGRD